MHTHSLLSIEGLKIEARNEDYWKPIIHGVSLTLTRGKVLGLIGESGAGKSTIALAAMGFTRPGCRIASGSIVFDGLDVLAASKEDRRKLWGERIAYVAQSAAASFNPSHRLIHQLAEGLVQRGLLSFAEAEKKGIALYRQLDLPEPDRIGYRYPHQVSGGQLQRAMVAMAMVGNPDIIIFDEPTTALDVTTQIEVLAAIKDAIRRQKTGVIYITHDLAVVAQLADHIMVLRNGSVVEEGSTRKILKDPQKKYTQRLLAVRSLRENRAQPANGSDVILDAQNISAGYTREAIIVKHINLKIFRGKTFALVGESGSGKTSLARVITGLLPLFEGKIFFMGQPLAPSLRARDRECLRRLQMIFQMPDVALNPRQKVRNILERPLAFYFSMHGAAREKRVNELMEMIELPQGYIERYPAELSGGEKQRICIARALAAQPDLIICDEITSALDQLVAEEVLRLLEHLQKHLGVSYLFITHDLETVEVVADEIAVMLQGSIVEQGPQQMVLRSPQHKYTELLISSVPEMDPDWLDHLLAKRVAGIQ